VLSDAGYCQNKSFDQIDNAPEEKKEVLQLIHLTLSTKLLIVITLTLTTRSQLRKKHGYVAQMDGAILVVAATDGPMPQTREHILLGRQVGIPRMVVHEQSGYDD
jgi:elongation factor Tu